METGPGKFVPKMSRGEEKKNFDFPAVGARPRVS